jgi:hypothetical protein
MKTYRIEFACSTGIAIVNLIMLTILCIFIVGIPVAIATLPTLYRVIEEDVDR